MYLLPISFRPSGRGAPSPSTAVLTPQCPVTLYEALRTEVIIIIREQNLLPYHTSSVGKGPLEFKAGEPYYILDSLARRLENANITMPLRPLGRCDHRPDQPPTNTNWQQTQ